MKDIARYSLAPQVQKHTIIDTLSIGLTRKIEIDMSNVLGIAFEDGKGANIAPNNIRQVDDPTQTANYDSEPFNSTTRFPSHASSIQNAQKFEYREAGLIRSSSDRIIPALRENEEERSTSTRSHYQTDRMLESKLHIS